MNLQRKLTMVVATGAIALGAGHFVQERAGARATAEPPAVRVSGVIPVAAGPADIEVKPVAIQPPVLPAEAAPVVEAEPVSEVLAVIEPAADLQAMPETTPVAALDCPIKLELLAQPGAMIGLTLLAPCQPDQRVVLKHAGLAVTGRTSASGALFTTLPALTGTAEVDVVFVDGARARATLPVAEFADVRRFAVQWQDEDAFQLHVFENGAGYNQPGHISATTTGASTDSGGVIALGDATVDLPLRAEVYTFGPAAMIDLVLEAAVTSGTCGREILGETIFAKGGSVEITDLTLAMPDCNAVGDILVLKNLLQDMTLATAN